VSEAGRRAITLQTVIVLAALVAAPGLAQRPRAQGRIHDVELIRVSLDRPLADYLEKLKTTLDEPAWLAYDVPLVEGWGRLCCHGGCASGWSDEPCKLESHRRSMTISDDDRAWGGSDSARVLWRVVAGQVTEILAYSCDCSLDAGGRALYLLEGVDPGESVALLEATLQARGTRARDLDDEALMALAVHAGREADQTLIALARGHDRRQVRSRALFWLAQKAHGQAEEALGQAVTDDPDAEVREHAVFAVSQLPDDQAVPLLVKLARSNPHAEVRRAALFWLGQSEDPRALDLFEEILSD